MCQKRRTACTYQKTETVTMGLSSWFFDDLSFIKRENRTLTRAGSKGRSVQPPPFNRRALAHGFPNRPTTNRPKNRTLTRPGSKGRSVQPHPFSRRALAHGCPNRPTTNQPKNRTLTRGDLHGQGEPGHFDRSGRPVGREESWRIPSFFVKRETDFSNAKR